MVMEALEHIEARTWVICVGQKPPCHFLDQAKMCSGKNLWSTVACPYITSLFHSSKHSSPMSHVLQSHLEGVETRRTVRTMRLCAWPLLHTLQEGTWARSSRGKIVHIMSPSRCRQVEMARLRSKEEAASAAREKKELEQTVCSLERELAAKQEEVQSVQVRGCWMRAVEGPGVTLQPAPHYQS